jgi:ABC-2 type transport system ATP-binding protein
MTSQESDSIIETHSLRKEFGDKVAVEDLTLSVRQGEVFGFLGPNGAGKTTSVKMLLSLIAPTSGTGSLFGKPLGDPLARSLVGFLPEHFRFHEWLTAREFLRLHADLYGMAPQDSVKRIDELLELVGLTPHTHKKLKAFSKGMLQRIGLAQALLNRPKLVILDEPTSGLDPVGRRLVRDIIRDLKQAGTTVFLNSHLLSEVEITCDRVAFIKFGQIIKISELSSLMDGAVSVNVRASNLQPETIDGLSSWSHNIRYDPGQPADHLSLTVTSEAELPAINRYLVERGVEVYALQPEHVSLEDLFIQIIGTDGGL